MKMVHVSPRVATRGWLALAVGALMGGAVVGGCGPTYPNCDNDEQCHENEYCVNGTCQQCRDDAHCPAGQRCSSGSCEPIPGWCNSDTDCPSDQECVENFCQPRPVQQTQTELPPPGPCQLAAVYFGFDDSALDDSARRALETNVTCMGERSIQNVMITGMTDPRGTEEYNMALGDRRARTTRDHLQRLGVERRRMQTRSVGEEQATGGEEGGWARDRRAELTER